MRFRAIALVAIAACSRAPAPSADTSDLPAIAGFTASAIDRTPDYERRTYARGAVRVTVTIGRFPVDDRGWDSWVAQSNAYPQAALGVSPDRANGFYECDDAGHCNLLVQLRSGVHVEIRGDGTAARADVDDVAHGLPLGRMAEIGQ